MHYYSFNIKEYRKDTGYLSLLEHAIYRALIDTYYLDELPLCDDIAKLMRTHGVKTKEEKTAFDAVLADFFILTDDGYRHEKCDSILSQIYDKSAKARASAKIRWEKHNANAMRTHTEGSANGMLPINPLPNNPITQDKRLDQQVDLARHKKSKYKFDDHQKQFATWMSNPVVNRFGEAVKIDLDQWADAVRKIFEVDKVSPQDLENIWRFIIDHDDGGFSWADQIRTPMKLRLRKDGLQYHQKIKTLMERSTNAKPKTDIFDDDDTEWADEILGQYDSDGNFKQSAEIDPGQFSSMEEFSQQGSGRVFEGVPQPAPASDDRKQNRLDGKDPEGVADCA